MVKVIKISICCLLALALACPQAAWALAPKSQVDKLSRAIGHGLGQGRDGKAQDGMGALRIAQRNSLGISISIPIDRQEFFGQRISIVTDATDTMIREKRAFETMIQDLLKGNAGYDAETNAEALRVVSAAVKRVHGELLSKSEAGQIQDAEHALGKFWRWILGGYTIDLTVRGAAVAYAVPRVQARDIDELVSGYELIPEFFFALREHKKRMGVPDHAPVSITVITRIAEEIIAAIFRRPDIQRTLGSFGIDEVRVIGTKIETAGKDGVEDYDVIHAPVAKDGKYVFPSDGDCFFGDNREAKEFGAYPGFVNVQALGERERALAQEYFRQSLQEAGKQHGVAATGQGDRNRFVRAGPKRAVISYDPLKFRMERLKIVSRMFFHGAVEAWNVSRSLQVIGGDVRSLGMDLFAKDKGFALESYQMSKQLLDFAHGKNGYVSFMNDLIGGNVGNVSEDEILNYYEKLYARYEQLKNNIERFMQRGEDSGIHLDKRKLDRMHQGLLRLDEILSFLLVRFAQGRLKEDETVEDLAALFEKIHAAAESSHIMDHKTRRKVVPALHIRADASRTMEGTDKFAVESFCDQLAFQAALERFVSNAVHLGINNMYVTLKKEDDRQIIVMEDDGEGIEEDFTADDESNDRQVLFLFGKSKRGGSGAGMALAWHVIRMLGGRVTAGHSNTHGGAQFTIEIPLRKGEPDFKRSELIDSAV